MKYAEFERTHQDHQVQLLDLHWVPQDLLHVPESVIQTLLEFREA